MKGESIPFSNRRLRKSGHSRLLDVKVRATTAKRQRLEKVSGWLWKLILVLFLAGASYIGVTKGVQKFFFDNPEYTLHKITVDSDDSLTHDEIIKITGISEGQNVFSVNLAKAEEALHGISCISDVHIDRILPDQIAIWLRGRTPVAWIAQTESADPYAPENALFTDAAGQLFKPLHILPENYRMPVIHGVNVADIHKSEPLAIDDLRLGLELLNRTVSQPGCLLTIRALDISKGYCINVTSDKGVLVTFDTRDFDTQLNRLQVLIEHCQQSGQELKSVNLMVWRNTPVTFVMAAPPAEPPAKPSTSSHGTRRKLKND